MFNSLLIRLNNHPGTAEKIMDDSILQSALKNSSVTVFAEGIDPKKTLVYHPLPFFSPRTNIPTQIRQEVAETGKSLSREINKVRPTI